MQVQVNVKHMGRRKNAIETHPYEIGEVRDVGALITAFVTAEVARFNARFNDLTRGQRQGRRHSPI